MSAVKRWLDAVLGAVVAGLMGVAVLNVLWQVFSRYVLGSPSSWTEELARYLLIWIGLLGAAYALGKGQHLAIDLLPQMLKGRRRAGVLVLVHAAVGVFSAAVPLWGGVELVRLQLHLGQDSAAMGVPMGYVYLALPLGGACMVVYAVAGVVEQVRVWGSGEGEHGVA